ncbi:hypothetical protein [Mucilaginibacter sp. L3T2-6]|uniref:hypothetical protein n=1 Tax=Mucilaginibacter sp. L3T2-6 TaxID=3062491 RepID=UPI0026747668|nr:hypothetical protein [Mucilaginibacter sp. L3T2-6]MDO3645096.1 hypothetical protein [Mucilaginibacter sp. L3T2-6]MDV6217548.1 hypothetical protein [Mucilaginibacter sp. L3T2-6]
MKANHNQNEERVAEETVVLNISFSKNESKSQLWEWGIKKPDSCSKYQFFKE